jgi:16S rRNA (uracil1498-N3)-methyltransferase
VIPYEFSRQRLTISFAGKQVLFVIGSEGGFTPEEVEAAHQAGFVEISLGETILRVDTAGIFVIAMVRAEELRQSSA